MLKSERYFGACVLIKIQIFQNVWVPNSSKLYRTPVFDIHFDKFFHHILFFPVYTVELGVICEWCVNKCWVISKLIKLGSTNVMMSFYWFNSFKWTAVGGAWKAVTTFQNFRLIFVFGVCYSTFSRFLFTHTRTQTHTYTLTNTKHFIIICSNFISLKKFWFITILNTTSAKRLTWL